MHPLYPSRRVLWLPFDYDWEDVSDRVRHCCDEMNGALAFTCDLHDSPWDCGDYTLIYHPLFKEYGLMVKDGGPSYVLIDHCPFCGTKLPDRKRDWWFDDVERLGLDDAEVTDLPQHLKP